MLSSPEHDTKDRDTPFLALALSQSPCFSSPTLAFTPLCIPVTA